MAKPSSPRRCRLGLVLVLALAAGCRRGEGVQGTVSGQVVFAGKPLPGGWLTFRPADPKKKAVTVKIDEKGNYEATLPAGEVQVAIDNRDLQYLSPGRDAGQPKLPGVRIPPKSAGSSPTPGSESTAPRQA